MRPFHTVSPGNLVNKARGRSGPTNSGPLARAASQSDEGVDGCSASPISCTNNSGVHELLVPGHLPISHGKDVDEIGLVLQTS
jgi:hypothetical protein